MSLPERVMGAARSFDPRVVDGGIALALTVWALTEAGTLSDPGRALVLVAMTVAVAWLPDVLDSHLARKERPSDVSITRGSNLIPRATGGAE